MRALPSGRNRSNSRKNAEKRTSASIQGPMTERHILYSFRRCPYAMRARMAIAVSGLQVELREVILRDKPAEMLTASPKATVPVLLLSSGKIIDESLDIMRWVLSQNDPQNWLAEDGDALIAENDGRFKTALDAYKYPNKPGVTDPVEPRTDGMAFLAKLQKRLETQTFLCGERPTLADIAIFPFVRQFAATDADWFNAQPLPHLQGWLERHVGSPMFAQIMVRYPQWQAGDAPTPFPT